MELVMADKISPVEHVPGLFISGISVACSPDALSCRGIDHVLSLTSQRDCPQIAEGIQHLHLQIEDNPFEDLLMVLDGLCAWIEDGLCTGQVLIHCLQGISRSGAVVIGYLMRARSIPYEAALDLARRSRSVIAPNSGFVDQLRLWEQLDYTIYETTEQDGPRTTKREYEEWRASRGILLSRVEDDRQQFMKKSMADMAARFGKLP